MQNAKDTFYTTLRNGIAVVNPERTMALRGVIRPGVLVEENELPTMAKVPDVFRLRWTNLSVDETGPAPLATMRCEIRYATDGSPGVEGMDRGRLLSAMDGELLQTLATGPRSALKMMYGGSAPQAMMTMVFWGDISFAPIVSDGGRSERVAMLDVFCFREAGES